MKKKSYVDFDKGIWLSLTEKCNWKCWYCNYPNREKPQTISLEYLDYALSVIKNCIQGKNIEVSVEGGEIGLCSRKLLDKFFYSDLSETYTVTTNGLFMKNNYHNLYRDKIHHILYHVLPEIEDNKLDFPKHIYDGSIEVLHTIVIHKGNLHLIDEFFDMHPYQIWVPHFLQPRRTELDFMSRDDFKYIQEIIKSKDNIHPDVLPKVEMIADVNYYQWKTHQKLCRNIYTKPIIDLPRGKIHRCCVSMETSSIDFNEENLQKVIDNEFVFPFKDSTCKQCIANFVWIDNDFYRDGGHLMRKILKRKG